MFDMFDADSPSATLMISRVERGECAYCGIVLPAHAHRALGRICPLCIAPDSHGVRVMSRYHPTPEEAKSSYWLLEKYFGSFALIDSLPPAPAGPIGAD